MALNQQWDSLEPQSLDLPYNRIEKELSGKPRLVRGENMYITLGGKLSKRPGTTLMTNGTLSLRVDRLWVYETQENPPKVYLIASCYNSATTNWELWYQRMSNPVGSWTQFASYRDCNSSTRPHEGINARGLFFIKGYPSSGSSEKLGSIIFDGTGGSPTIKPWGVLGPTTPARIKGSLLRLNADLDSSSTSISVDLVAGSMPATPFEVTVDFEDMTVTNVAGAGPYILTITRAINDTVAAEHVAESNMIYRNWSASTHLVEVRLTWGYSYAYKTITGQVSNRVSVEENPDLMPSYTGPFADLCPTIIVQGHADTTNIPEIIIYRTTDGGGTWYELETITNTGAGNIEYRDDSLASDPTGTTFNDPIPDEFLDTATLAPSLTSNSPPPANIAPQVTGVDPVSASTPLAYYSGRIWFGIGNYVFYSAQEELNSGIPEESFPSGLTGNFFQLQYPIQNLVATTNSLFVITLQTVVQITGNNRETFNARPLFDNYGTPYGHPRAITRFGDTVAFLTHDYRIATFQDGRIQTLSDPLFTDIVDQINRLAEFDIKYWADLEKEWLVVTGHVATDTAFSKQWVYDIKKAQIVNQDFWFTPWTIRSTAMASGRISEVTAQRRLIFYVWNQDTSQGWFVRLDPTGRTGTDYFNTDDNGFSWYFDTNLMQVPPGNHVNNLRQPGIVPTIYGFAMERTLFPGDEDPQFYYYTDDFWTTPLATFPQDPARREASTAYKTMILPLQTVGQRIALRAQSVRSTDLFELQNFWITWTPDTGSGV